MRNNALIILFIFLFQETQAQLKNAGIEVISATEQDWIGGAKGMTGTTYTVKVRILSNKPINFTGMWLYNQSISFDVQTFFKDPNKKPAEGDSVLLVYVKRNQMKPAETVHKPLPVKYKGDALVEFTIAGKARYFTIKKFSKLATIKGI